MATYTVKKGDTLSEIAAANNTSVANLVKLNDITNPNYIVVGQVLQLSGSTTTKKKNTTSKPTIKAFGVQSNTENTMYATWKWDKSNTKEYRVLWHYATGDGVWFVGSDSTVTVKQATYSPPSNATKVKFKVKAVSKTRKVNGKDTAYWTSQWSTEKTYTFDLDDPEKPSVPSVSIDKYKLTAEIDTYDKYTHYVYFQVVKDDKTLFKTGMAKVTKNHASWSCTVTAGHEYKVRCQGARSYKSGSWTKYDYGEYSEYSANVSTIPAASKGIKTLKTQSETSVLIDWYNVSNATSYEIQYTTKKGYFDSSNEVSSMTVDSVVGHAEVTGLESGNEYFFRVRAVNDQGESAWTEIKSVIVGKKPAVPTTWSSTTTGIVGEDIALYWAHNSEDASDQHGVAMELNIGGSITNIILYTESGTNSVDVDEITTYTFYGIKLDTENELDIGDITVTVTLKEANGVCVIPTDTYSEGTNIKWRVKTKGILAEFSDWSIERVVDIYAPPTLELNVTNSDGTALETIESFPFYVSGVAGPDTQKVIGYHISVIADEGYVTEDQIGNEQTISPGQEVYSNYFDISEDLLLELTPSSLDLENNISYTVNGTVSMDSGLTAEASTSFTVSWTDLEYEPNAEINIDRETLTASIRPYVEIDTEGETVVTDEGLKFNTSTGMPYRFSYGCAVVYNEEIYILGGDDRDRNSWDFYKWSGDGEWSSIYPDLNAYNYTRSAAVVYNNEIHLLGGYDTELHHYRYNGTTWTEVSTLPYDFYYGSAVVYNNEIHILGTYDESSRTAHYKWDGTTWTEVSTLPYEFYRGCAVVLNNEIHILGTYDESSRTAHYKWDGTTWTEVSTLPYEFYYGSAVVYNNEIHILGGYSDEKAYYKWDGTIWTEVSTLPYEFCHGCAVSYRGAIHLLGSSDNEYEHCEIKYEKTSVFTPTSSNCKYLSTAPYNTSDGNIVVHNNEIHLLGGFQVPNGPHYKWDGNTWTEVSTLPYYMWNGKAVSYNNELHILGGGDHPGVTGKAKSHYKWDGTTWTEVSTLPYEFCYGSAVVLNNEIHILGSWSGGGYSKSHYKWDGTTWTEVSTLPYEFCYGSAVVLNNEIHILGTNDESGRTAHYKWDGKEWSFVSTLPYEFRFGSAVVYNNEIHIMGGSYTSDRITVSDNHYKFDGMYWVEIADTFPCPIGYSETVVYNDEIHIIKLVDTNSVGYTGQHYKLELENPFPPCTLSVYRREFDGAFKEIATNIVNGSNTWVPDPHPALDYARYRIVAIDNSTGSVSYCDLPGYPVGEKAVIIQWNEEWSYFDVTNEDEMEKPPWEGSMLKLPYNIDVADKYDADVSLVGYIGRRNPVSYYGTQIGETASWKVDIDKKDEETLYALRRLAIWMGDVYVREPSGSGYWAHIKVSFSQTHCELTIPVTLDITRVEGGI